MKEQDRVRRALEDLGAGYELLRELGRGATAIVYLVHDHELDRELAVKVIRSTFAGDEEAAARLDREARLVAKLQHPNIVRVFSTRRISDGSLVLLMEHVPGRNLKEVLRAGGPFEPARALHVLRDIASALAYAHRRRIVHRDVKPENIYIDEEVGAARLADFGIARPWDRDARLTVPGEALGTPAYMSPEQIDGDDVDARTDVYSLGLVGYEMLTGEHPWEGDSLFTIIFKQKNETLPPLRSQRPDLPRELVNVLERALQKDRGRRWKSADVLLERLEAIRLGAADVAVAPWTESMDRPFGGIPGGEPAAGKGDASRGAPARREGSASRAGLPAGGGEAAESAETPDATRPPATVTRGRADHAESGAGQEGGPSGARRWRKGRLALTGAALGLVALAAWSWTSWGGSSGGWVDLGQAEPGVRPESGEEVPPRATGPGPDEASDPGTAGPGAAVLQVVDDEVPGGGVVGASVPLVLQVPPTDSAARVRFRVVEGEGVLNRETAEAGPDGRVHATLRLPDQAGVTTVAASLEGGEGAEVVLDLVARPGPPQQVQAIVGDGQVGDAGSPLAQALGVRVVDARGNVVPDADVRFQVLTGDGSVQPPRARTDSLGRAFARWSLGPFAGAQRAAALVPSADESTVVFGATATPVEPEADPGAVSPPTAGDPTDDPSTDPAGPPPSDAAGDAPPEDLPPVRVVRRALAVGGIHTCLIGPRGFAECRGALDPDEAAGAVRVRFAALAAGVRHTCGLDATGTAYCWGANDQGQLGDGTRSDRPTPTAVETPTTFSRLALGLNHSCGLDGGGRVHCWGANPSGQLGDDTRTARPLPGPATGPAGAVEVAAGWNHTCVLDAEGRALCWGLNADGQLGDGTRADRTTPTAVAGSATFARIAAGSAHTCGLGGGVVLCWGADGSGQLGIGGSAGQVEPGRLESLPATVVDITTGALHTCALLQGGEAWCWGQNLHGQLGDGSTTDRRLPTPVAGDLSFRALVAGGGSTCGVTADGGRYCWGLNQGGQLGDGSRANRSTPTRVGG